MTTRFLYVLVLLMVHVTAVYGQSQSQPFASVDQAVKVQRGGWAGDKSQLSAVFAAERRALGDKFETELPKWLGRDVEKHYWIAYFLESDDYLYGNKRLPQLSLLVMQQGLSLAYDKADERSRGYVVSLSIIAATLSAELGFSSLAISHKDEAEGLLKENPDLTAHVPAMHDADRRRYDNIPTNVDRPTPVVIGGPASEVIDDSNPAPRAQISGGVLNGKAVRLVKPAYSGEARDAGASGEVNVSVVFDEQGQVIWAQATSGHPLLRTLAEKAALESTFPPTKLSGKPVKVRGVVIYRFMP